MDRSNRSLNVVSKWTAFRKEERATLALARFKWEILFFTRESCVDSFENVKEFALHYTEILMQVTEVFGQSNFGEQIIYGSVFTLPVVAGTKVRLL